MPSRLADLVRRARRLSAERDRMVDAVATEWARALRGQRLTATDLDELWAALTEDALRQAVPGEGQLMPELPIGGDEDLEAGPLRRG